MDELDQISTQKDAESNDMAEAIADNLQDAGYASLHTSHIHTHFYPPTRPPLLAFLLTSLFSHAHFSPPLLTSSYRRRFDRADVDPADAQITIVETIQMPEPSDEVEQVPQQHPFEQPTPFRIPNTSDKHPSQHFLL